MSDTMSIPEPAPNRVSVAPSNLVQPVQRSGNYAPVKMVRVMNKHLPEGVLMNQSTYEWFHRTRKPSKAEEAEDFELYDPDLHGDKPVLWTAPIEPAVPAAKGK